jgi:hypothetical protein
MAFLDDQMLVCGMVTRKGSQNIHWNGFSGSIP